MPLANLAAELMGTFPRLPYLHSIQLTNRAWQRFQDLRMWSFMLVPDAQLFVPTAITAGTVSAVYQSTTLTMDATGAAALNAIPGGIDPPLGSATLGLGRQIRLGASNGVLGSTGTADYNIVSWDGTSALVIDKPYGESTQSGAGFIVYKCFYAAPSLPFTTLNVADGSMIRFMSLTNKNSGYTIRGRKLWYTQETLSAVDPQHSATGDAYIVASYGRNAVGQPVYELYPHPVNQTTYSANIWTRWPNLTATQDFPQMPYALSHCVMDLARKFCCDWAMANTATYKELQMVNWVSAGQNYKQEFMEGLRQCIKQDDEISPLVPFSQSSRFDFPLGGQFLQSHDVSSLI